MTNRIRDIFIPVFFITSLIWIRATGIMNALSVPSYCRQIYIPLAFWSVVLLYVCFLHLSFYGSKKDMATTFRFAAVFGFFTNLYIALTDLIIALSREHSFLSGYYFYYVEMVAIFFTFSISLSAVLMLATLKNDNSQNNTYRCLIFSPLFVLPPIFLITLFDSISRIFFFASIAAYLIPWLGIRKGPSSAMWAKIKSIVFFIWKDRNFMICLFIADFLIRCFFAVNVISKTEANGANRFVLASDDGDGYDRFGTAIAKNPSSLIGKEVKLWGGYYDYAYTIFIAGIYKVFGRNFYAVTFIQSFLGAFLPVIVFLIGRTLLSKSTGVLAATALALKNPIVFLSVVLGHEAVWMPILTLFVLMMAFYYKNGRRSCLSIGLAGVALGFVCVFRGLFINLIPFTALWIMFFWRDKKVKERTVGTVIFVLCALIIIYSASIIFKSPLSSGSKDRIQSIWELNHLYDQFKGIGNDQLMNIGINFTRDIRGSIDTIISHPVIFIKVALRIYPLRIIGYLSAHQFGFFDLLYLVNSAKFQNSFMSFLEFYFTLFFIYGLFLCVKKRDILKSPIFLMLSFIIFVFAIIFIHITPRQKAVSTPFVYLVGSYGLVDIVKRICMVKYR